MILKERLKLSVLALGILMAGAVMASDAPPQDLPVDSHHLSQPQKAKFSLLETT